MGEIADDMIDSYMFGDPFSQYRDYQHNYYGPRRVQKVVVYSPSLERKFTWVTARGEELQIKHMESGHILNCVHLLERNNWNKGRDFLDNAPTYKYMVNILLQRRDIRKGYFQLTLDQRSRVGLL